MSTHTLGEFAAGALEIINAAAQDRRPLHSE
jgi:hypothetical protein